MTDIQIIDALLQLQINYVSIIQLKVFISVYFSNQQPTPGKHQPSTDFIDI